MDGQTYPDCAPVPGAEALFTQARTPRSFSPRPVGRMSCAVCMIW